MKCNLRLKQILFKKNLSEVALEERMNTSKQYINGLANGKGNPTLEALASWLRPWMCR